MIGNAFDRRERKRRAVLIKHCRKVKGEQAMILQIVEQLITKNIKTYQDNYFVVSVNMSFC